MSSLVLICGVYWSTGTGIGILRLPGTGIPVSRIARPLGLGTQIGYEVGLLTKHELSQSAPKSKSIELRRTTNCHVSIPIL